jgi:hypothetical protein
MRGALLLNSAITGSHRACGGAFPNAFGRRYEGSEAFRRVVSGKVGAGVATVAEIRTLLGLRDNFHVQEPVPFGTHALVERAGRWMDGEFWPSASRGDWPPERVPR